MQSSLAVSTSHRDGVQTRGVFKYMSKDDLCLNQFIYLAYLESLFSAVFVFS